MSTESVHAVTLFYCYAREDERLLKELEKHLAPLKRQGYLNGWYDRQIEAGMEWKQEIELHLSAANLILILLSPDFVHSDACDEEMHRALEMHHTGRARVIPLLLRPILWEGTPLAELERLPDNGQPITTWSNQDQAFRQIAYHISNIVRKQLDLPPLQIQDWQALLFSASLEPSSPQTQLLAVAPSFEPRNPYRGLHAFNTENASDFFGRERLIAELLKSFHAVLDVPRKGDITRLLSVVGPSGSGKSSAVLAGLLPALKRGELPGSEHWIYLEPIVPGQHPLEELARTLSYQFPQRSLVSLHEDLAEPTARGLHLLFEALVRDKSTTLFLYIDQFEEVFTQTLEVEERTQFLNLLLTALTEPHGALALVISLRADFYDRPMLYVPRLFRLMKVAQVEVLPLEQRDLRDVIKKPAALPDVQLRFEDDLAGELLAEMRGQSGALPLLQFTLDQLFQARQGRILTLAAYHAMGGVQGALAQHAEAIYASLPAEEYRTLTRALFLCLVEPGAVEQNPTRQRVVLSELVLGNPAQARLLEVVVALFTDARLLTTTSQDGIIVVEVSHEAVIRGWARLANWLRDAHEDLYLKRRVREDAVAWIRQRHSAARLYRDEQLAESLAWKQHFLLSRDEELFLQASVNEQERQRLLSRQQAAQQQKRYRRRVVLVGLGGLGLAAVAASVTNVLLAKNAIRSSSPLSPFSLPYTYKGHKNNVSSAAWSPDGKRLASASDDKTVQVWDARSGQILLTYTGHMDVVNSVAWSPDGKRLASSGGNTAQVWDASSGHTLLTYAGHTDYVTSAAWSPDGKRLASAIGDNTVRVWDASSGHTLLTYVGHTHFVNSVAWSPDGRRLASASEDNSAQVWDASSGETLLTYTDGYTDVMNSVAWSPDGKRLASSGGNTAQVWDASSGETLLTYTGHTYIVESVAWSSDGKRLASASWDKTVQVWDASSGETLIAYTGHTDVVNSVAWSPDGKRLASASNDKTVRVWDANLNTGRTVLTYTGHTNYVYSVAWSPDGKRLASASNDGTVQVWDASSGHPLLIYTGHTNYVKSVTWSPDGKRLASASGDKTVQVWDANSGHTLFTYTGHTDVVGSVAWSPDGKRLASAGADKTVQVWDASSGHTLLTYTGHSGRIWSVAWSPDGKRLASASADKTVQVWDASSGHMLFTYTGHSDTVNSVAWSPDGKRLASAGADKTVQVWDASSGHTLFTYTGHTDSVYSVAWSPGSKRLTSAGADKTVQVWDASSGHMLFTYTGHTDSVYSVAWSPGSKRLASASGDKTVQVWLWVEG